MSPSPATAHPPLYRATSATADRMREPTLASTWQAVAGSPIRDELLEWPPDVFALTDVILERAEAYRFVLSPPDGVLWPPGRRCKLERRGRAGSATVECVGRGSGWCSFLSSWRRSGLSFGSGSRSRSKSWRPGGTGRVCEALLTLHAIADEACAGLFVALDRSDGEGCCYRARGRELLARAGSLARMPSRFVRVLPEDPHATDGKSVVLTLRLCLSSGSGDPLAQAACSSSRYGPPGRARPAAAAAVAAAGQRV